MVAYITKRRRRMLEEQEQTELKDETRRGITGVVLFVLAGLSLLSFFDLAGPFGVQVDNLEGMLLGWMRFILPVVLIVLGIAFLRPAERAIHSSAWLGFILFFLSTTGILHLFIVGKSTALDFAHDGRYGGYLGYGVAFPLAQIVGAIAASIILVALFIISGLLILNASPASLAQSTSLLGRMLRALRGMFSPRWREQRPAVEEPLTPFEKRELESALDEEKEEPKEAEAGLAAPQPKKRRQTKRVELPLDLLSSSSTKAVGGDTKMISERIKKTLANFGIEVEMADVNVGPTVTQYTMKPADGVKLAQIVTLGNDLALALAAHPIRIEAPIPGKALVGVEVPNQSIARVTLKEMLESDVFKNRKSNLAVAIGKDVSGTPIIGNLESMPHLLIAGSTGSGKSVAMKSIITGLLYQNQPDELKFILVDPKRVELTIFDDIPHLITPVITEVKKTVNALKWTVAEMDRRYHLLSAAHAANIATYNRVPEVETLPYITIVIDELADLMATSANDVEAAIVRLAQMARAVGIHLIVATQRPSVDVITGLIKANITTRMAFSVASSIDSRTILDTGGAEKLLGRGDMLYVSGDLKKPLRIQGAMLDDDEIKGVVKYLRSSGEPEYEETVVTKQATSASRSDGDDGSEEDDLYDEAKEIVIDAKKASASLLQRRLRIGYARAARLLDIMEEGGVIGPLDGARPREVLVGGDGEPNVDMPLPADDGLADEPPPEDEDVERKE